MSYIPLKNSAGEIKASGRVVRKGLRFNAGTETRQPVINVKCAVKRSYLKQGETKWTDVIQYYDLSLWGDQAVSLKKSLEQSGDLATLAETNEVRMEFVFHLADIVVKPWGGSDGREVRYELSARAREISVLSIVPSNYQGGSQAEPEQEEPEEITSVL